MVFLQDTYIQTFIKKQGANLRHNAADPMRHYAPLCGIMSHRISVLTRYTPYSPATEGARFHRRLSVAGAGTYTPYPFYASTVN